MTKIKLLGRARGGRCVFCHDDLRGDAARRCPSCHATWHPDCGEGAAHCPTRGCTSPPADARGGSSEQPKPELGARRFRAWRGRRGGVPGAGPRAGPLERLILSAVTSALVSAAASLFLAWPLVDRASFWDMLKHGKNHSVNSDGFAIVQGIFAVGVALVVLVSAAHWLWRTPDVWREVTTLLDETEPTLMFMTISTVGSGKNERTYANLKGERGEHDLSLPIAGLLPPGWLREHDQEPVLVYGLPPPGPYVLEFEDGALALVHPD